MRGSFQVLGEMIDKWWDGRDKNGETDEYMKM